MKVKAKGIVKVYPHQKPNEEVKLIPWKVNPTSEWEVERYGVCLVDEGIEIDVECEFDAPTANCVAKYNKDKAIEELRSNTALKIESIEKQYQKWLAISVG